VLRIARRRLLPTQSIAADGPVSRAHSSGRPQHSKVALSLKRAIDIFVGAVVGIVALPAMIAIAAAIQLDSPGPVLFRAKRVGRHGRHFSMLKFRTMIVDAEQRLNEVAHLNVAEGMVKIPNDPRVTRVGKWLRRFSLDELPQVLNVVAGHMSLVGPRPHDVSELPPGSRENGTASVMRPGVTGLWQVTARSDPRLATRIHYDHRYVHHWSLLLDAKILAKTIPTVVLAQGGLVDRSAATGSENAATTHSAMSPELVLSSPVTEGVDTAPTAIG
jgi:lipopolysaccharide/colanic/teichoic acid biosynthesis glycosyltransferase